MIDQWIAGCKRVGITGHIRPDGDCLGSCMALKNYINDSYPEVEVDVHLEVIPEKFRYINGVDDVDTEYRDEIPYDVFFSLDSGDVERIGKSIKYFENAKKTISVDHHISNIGYSEINVIKPYASSACEVLFDLMDYEKISYNTAVALYTGIIHDTGMLKHSNVSEKTLLIAGKLIAKGIPFSKIVDESFFQKTEVQNKLMAACVLESILLLDGRFIVSVATTEMMEKFGATTEDLDGIVDQLRITKGVEVAALLHEVSQGRYKVSLRANDKVNVNKIASSYGGGGHIKASGCVISEKIDDVIKKLSEDVRKQL